MVIHETVGAREEIERARDIEEAVRAARRSISAEIADELADLAREPFDAEQGDQLLNLDSVKYFLDFCVRKGDMKAPVLSATPDGIVEGDWRRDPSHRVSIEFFPDGKVWVYARDGDARASAEMPAADLLTDRSVIRLPEWL